MKKIYLLVGIPASGKTTWIKERLNEKDAWISRDKIRFSLVPEEEEYFSKENEVFKIFLNDIKAALKNDNIENIYIDATHLTQKSRRKVLDGFVWGINDELYVVNFNTNIDTCLKRNAKREGRERVPDFVINRMAKFYEKPTLNEKYRYKEIIEVE